MRERIQKTLKINKNQTFSSKEFIDRSRYLENNSRSLNVYAEVLFSIIILGIIFTEKKLTFPKKSLYIGIFIYSNWCMLLVKLINLLQPLA